MDCVLVHDPGYKTSFISSNSFQEEKNVKNIIHQVCTKLAACAFLAAVVSVGTASYSGLYQPKLPEALQKR